MSDCTVYIDESGDLGIGCGSKWFVLSAVIVEKSAEPSIRAKMAQIKTALNIHEIHLKKIREFFKRAYIVRELSGEEFVYMNVLVDTGKFDKSRIPTSAMAYNYICKYLLQRVSLFLESSAKTADIVLSARGTSRDNELIQYISDKLLPYPSNGIEASAFKTISAKTAPTWDLLQLADVCATSTFLAYEINQYGFCTPCFSKSLRGHLFHKNGKIDSYGIKYFANEMRPDTNELKKHWICVKKERTPGATAT